MAYAHGIFILEISDIEGGVTIPPITPGVPTLGPLALSGALRIGVPTSGIISGALTGSTISGNIPGITIDSTSRAYSGTPTGSAATIASGLIEVLAGAEFSPRSSPVTVLPAFPTVSLAADVSKAEGTNGPTIFTFTVTRSASTGAVVVPWSFSAGATSAADFTGSTLPTGGTVALADGVASGTFDISVNGDIDFESDELFTVSIAAPTGYVAGAKTSATGAILNDDAPPPAYLDADLNTAVLFKRQVLRYDQGSGDRAAQMYAAFPALKSYLNVGHKAASLTAGSAHPNWNASAERLDMVTGSPTLTGYDVQGMVYIGSGVAANVAISDVRVRAKVDGSETFYKVQKDSSDTLYKATIQDATLEDGQAVDPSWFELTCVLQRRSSDDNIKGGSGGGATKTQRISAFWGEACGYGKPAAHGDGIQYSSVGDSRVIASAFYSAPIADTAAGAAKYTGGYSTGSYGLTNAFRIDASNGAKKVERVHALGLLSAFGSLYPVNITAQATDSVTRNITLAHCVFAPAAFRYDGSAGDATQIHPSLTALADGGGLIENVGFYGNVVFGFGPMRYADRGAASADVTGIWHWNAATIDADTVALWKDLGLLDASGVPAAGMLRSVAGTITAQPKSIATTGAVPLNLDLSSIPDGATVLLHLSSGTNMHALEYVA